MGTLEMKYLILSLFITLTFFVFVNCRSNNNLSQINSLEQESRKTENINPELERNREIWSKSKICNYDLKLEVYETGLHGITSPVEIKVRNGIATETNSANKTVEKESLKEQYMDFETIEKLFDFIEIKFKEESQEYANNSNANKGNIIGGLKVSYSELGYPKRILFTPYRGAMDGDLAIIVKDLEDLSKTIPCQ